MAKHDENQLVIACLEPHPSYHGVTKCIYTIGHDGKHGALVPGTTLIQEWEDGQEPERLAIVIQLPKRIELSGRRATPRVRRAM